MTYKRVLCLVLAALLILLTITPGVAASSGVYFTMVNTDEPEELESGTMPFVWNGEIYVPQSTLEQLGLVFAHSTEPNTVRLSQSWNPDRYVLFDLESDTNVTSEGGSFPVVPLTRFGALFFPVGGVDSLGGLLIYYFDINFQIIPTEPAPTVRLYNMPLEALNHNVVLQNGDLLFGLRERYEAFTATSEGETGGSTVVVSPEPPNTTDPENPTDPDEIDPDDPDQPGTAPSPPAPAPVPVSISFVGLTAETDALLDALRQARIPAGFFVTAEDALAHPDTLRRLHSEGHQVGIFLTETAEEEYRAASEALFEAVRLRTVLVAASTEGLARDAYELGLVVFESSPRQMSNGAALEDLAGDILLDSAGSSAYAMTALPGVLRGNAFLVVSFISSLFS